MTKINKLDINNYNKIINILVLIMYFPLEKIFYYPSHYLFIPILSIFFLFRVKINKKEIFRYEIYFFIFFILSTFRSLFSKYTKESITLIIGFIISILYYLYFFYFLEKRKVDCIDRIIRNSTIIFLILNYLISITSYGKIIDRGLIRTTGVFTDPNLYCLAIIIPIGYFISNKRNFLENIIFYSSIILLLKTFSRGGMIGLFFLLFLVFFQKNKKKSIYLRSLLLFILFLILIYFFKDEILKYVDLGKFYSRISDFNIFNVENKSKIGSGRLGLWLSGIELLKKNLFFGVGMNNVPELLFEMKGDYHYLHNTFLEILVENGIIGSIFYFCFLFSFILQKNYNNNAKKIKNIIYAQLIISMFLTSLLSIQIFFTFSLYKYFNNIERR